MLCFPNCKINLGLYVTNKRSDGYHDLETVFYPVVGTNSGTGMQTAPLLNDILEIVPAVETTSHSNTLQIHISGLPVAGNSNDNLILKAYNLLHTQFPAQIGPLNIFLHKVIPMGAGLGGGSADGAFMLRLLNDFFNLCISNADLEILALQLGSDCPFFIRNTPQFASGRGELMSPIEVDLSAYSIQIVCPGVHVSTGKAFGMIMPKPAPFDLRRLHDLPVSEWKHHISNDFEAPVFAQHPELSEIKQQLYNQGAIYASMSGSGSAFFGIFNKGHRPDLGSPTGALNFFIA